MRAVTSGTPGAISSLLLTTSIVLLVLCVGMQALGAPVTLWDPGANADTLSGSIDEGFAIPAGAPFVGMATVQKPRSADDVAIRVAVLGPSVFHPPCPVG